MAQSRQTEEGRTMNLTAHIAERETNRYAIRDARDAVAASWQAYQRNRSPDAWAACLQAQEALNRAHAMVGRRG